MRRILAIFFFAYISIGFGTPVPAVEQNTKNVVTEKVLKKFRLDVADKGILNESLPADICCGNTKFNYDGITPSAGEQNLLDNMNVKPEFRYTKDSTYSPRLDQYDKEFKLKFKLPVDF